MKDQDLSAVPAHIGKTKEQLINELVETYQRIAKLERLETQHKRAEEALKKAKQEKTIILNSMSEHVVFQDLGHRVIWANKAAGESVGLAPEQLVGRHCYKIWPKRSKPCKGCPVAKALETGQLQEGEVTTPDGRVWFLRGYPIKDASGNVTAVVEVTLDITDRKHMETKLRESEERYRCLVENALDGVSVYRDSILFANDKLCELLGYSKEELYGMKVAALIFPGDRERVRRYITNRLAGRKAPTHYETRVLRKNGSIRHIEVAATRIMYKDQPAGQAVLRDITDRKQKEEELRKHRERLEELVKERTAELTTANEQLQQEITQRKQTEEALRKAEQEKRAILDSMSEFVVYQDKEMNILWANKAASEAVGLAPEQLVGRHCYEMWHQRSKPCVGCPIIKARKTGETHEAEVATPDGIVGFVRAHPLRDENGEVSGVVEVVLDITQRKRAEEALQASERMYRTLLENLPQKIFHKDKNSVYISCNENLARDLRIKPNEITGKTDYDFIPKKLAEKYRADDKRIIESGEIEDIEEKYIQDGKEVIIHTVKTPIKDEKGNIVGILGIFWDITQRKRTEEALRQSEEKYRTTFEHTGTAMAIAEEDTTISLVNAEVEKLTGYKKEEIEGKMSWTSFIHPEDLEKVKGYHYARREGKPAPKGYEFRLINRKGNIKNILLSVDIIPGTKKAVGSLIDITQRKHAEGALKESESKLRKQKMALEQKNIALREIVAQIEIEKNRIKEDIATNVNELLLPILAKLKIKEVSSKYVDLLKHHLQELASPFGRKITKKSVRLTPREIEMCALIKGGLTSKETAKLLSLSYKTVEKHRRNIRRKLRIANKNVNLASFLNTL